MDRKKTWDRLFEKSGEFKSRLIQPFKTERGRRTPSNEEIAYKINEIIEVVNDLSRKGELE